MNTVPTGYFFRILDEHSTYMLVSNPWPESGRALMGESEASPEFLNDCIATYL